MVQREDRAGFLLEAAETILLLRKMLRKHLESHFAAMLLYVFTQEYFAHSTLAQSAEDAIMRDYFGQRLEVN